MSYSCEDMLSFLEYNIGELKLDDLVVIGVIKVRRDHKEGRIVRVVEISRNNLSCLCAYSRCHLNEVEAALVADEAMQNCIRVLCGGQEIGYINLEGVFHFTQAPCLYKAVAWGMATGQGAIVHLSHEAVKNISVELTQLARSAKQHAHTEVALARRKEYFLARARSLINQRTYRDDACHNLPNIFWEVVEKRIFSA